MDKLTRIYQRCGATDICCGCPTEGAPGDGHLQPPDPPECCRQYESVRDVIVQIRLEHLAAIQRARLEGYNTAMVWHGRTQYQAKNYDQIKGGWKDDLPD